MKQKYITSTLLALAVAFTSSCGDKKTSKLNHDPKEDHSKHAKHSDDDKHDHSEHADEKGEHDDHEHEHDHEHDENCNHETIKAGPNGGRMIEDANAEFFITSDRKIQITFYDAQGKAIPAAGKSAIVVTGERPNQTEMTLIEANNLLVSEQAIAAGNNFPTIVEITSGEKTFEARFTLNLSDCPGCANKEYACECQH